MHKRTIHWALWIPVITTLISSLTLIAVTYLQVMTKAENINRGREHHLQRSLKPAEEVTVNASFKRGFYISTNVGKVRR